MIIKLIFLVYPNEAQLMNNENVKVIKSQSNLKKNSNEYLSIIKRRKIPKS